MRSEGCTALGRKFRYYFREASVGLRRNMVVTFAAIATVFIALFLLGFTLIIRKEVDLVLSQQGGKVEVSVFLRDDISSSQQTGLQDMLNGLPEVAAVTYESKDDAYQHALVLFRDQPDILKNLSADALPASFRVRLVDPENDFAVISARLEGQPGIEEILDQRELLEKLFAFTSLFRNGLALVAAVMMIAAGLLIANTVRIGLYARRREIGIMKLVGATNWFIRVPFLIEGIVAALVGAIAAIVVLGVLMTVFVTPAQGLLEWLPIVHIEDLLPMIPILLGAGVIVAVISSFLGMRRFLDT